MSAAKLSAYFKANFGTTPSTWIAEYRMEQAKLLLRETDLKVSDICARLGYSDVSNFIRKFREAEETTPSAYRKHHRNG